MLTPPCAVLQFMASFTAVNEALVVLAACTFALSASCAGLVLGVHHRIQCATRVYASSAVCRPSNERSRQFNARISPPDQCSVIPWMRSPPLTTIPNGG